MFVVKRCEMHENCTVVESKSNGMKAHYDVLPEDHHPVPKKEKE